MGEDLLTSDLCRHDEFSFIRCVLPLPIRGSDEVFNFGVWGSVRPDCVKAYIAASEANDPRLFPECFSWLANDLPLFESPEPVGCTLWPDDDPRMRPTLKAQDGPLKDAQDTGISFDQLLDIYAACGTDVRPHLTHS